MPNLFIPYQDVILKMNFFKQQEKPYLFVINFKKTQGICLTLDEINPDLIRFSIQSKEPSSNYIPQFNFTCEAIDFKAYEKKFNQVYEHIQKGNTYLCNLTQASKIETNLSLESIYKLSKAAYKLYIKNQFVVFSPESFIKIENQQISTFPIKGTKPVSEDPLGALLKSDPKETAEHNTIIDLMRNDISMVADRVNLKEYKKLEKIKTHNSELWQMSSEISGYLNDYYDAHPGFLFDKLCPAGSISGAPKHKTLSIIDETEQYDRGFYTGVFGLYNGQALNSAVMIRYIEQVDHELWFKSGGGITFHSQAMNEYKELIQKVYVPIF